jgi:O-antigen ligase
MRKSLLQKIWTAGLVLAAGSLLPLILASNSRSSLMTYIVILMVFFGSLFFDARKNRFWIGLSLAAMTGAAVFAASAALLGSPGGSFVNDMLEKFVTKSDDPTDGRIVTWLAVLGDITLVGRGDGAFSGNYGGMAHNTYIEVLGGMGPIALVFILAIHALALYLACRLLFRNIRQDGYAIGPLLVLLNYFVLGLTELVFGLLGNGIHIAFLLMVGVLLNETVSDGADWQFSPSESPQEQMSMQLGSETQ